MFEMTKLRYLPKNNHNFEKGRKYIGASDVPTLMLQFYPKTTPTDFYLEYIGEKEGFKGNSYTDAGNFLETDILAKCYVIQKYGRKCGNDFIISRIKKKNVFKGRYNGVKVELHSYTEFISPVNDRFVAHPDLLDLTDKEDPIIIQAKNTGEHAANVRKINKAKGYDRKDLSEQGIPLSVYYQEQWEMMCSGIPRSLVAVCIGGNDFKLYGEIKYDKERVESCTVAAVKMLECIDNKRPPVPVAWKDIIALFPELKKGSRKRVEGKEELLVLKITDEITKIDQKINKEKDKKADRVNSIGLIIGDNEVLVDSYDQVLATASDRKAHGSISYSKLKEDESLFTKAEKIGAVNPPGEASRQLRFSGKSQGDITKWTMITFEGDKERKSRKKYSTKEKKEATTLCDRIALKHKWERFR